MGTIRVGQKSPKTVAMGGFTIAPDNGATNTENKPSLSAEEKSRIVKNIMQLPKDQIVPALRKHGFNDIADITEAEMKAQDEQAKAVARENRLKEILALPVDEQLPLLLEEGFNEEAKELSEELAGLNGETADNADTNDEGQGEGDSDQGDDADNQVQQETSETPSAETSVDGETAKKENKEKSATKRGSGKSK